MRTPGGPLDRAMTPDEEQSRLLQDISAQIKKHAFYLEKAMNEDNLREALRFSSALLSELRTSLLTPQKYFELYMRAFNQLSLLQTYFSEESMSKKRSYADMYELVQHAGNVLPRLYLLCTVGSCYIKSKEVGAKDILKDLVEMCKGVQHPTRGLFLRSYLCQVSRGLLPDTGSEYEGAGGNVHDALDFLLQNFTEMNKLWVRMQHQGSARDRDRREKERQQLADLVGKNLTYVSQLDGLNFDLYCDVVLPRVMEQIISCKDDIAQQYLMQAVIQGFPDEFHLGTLEVLLGACPELQPGVRVHVVMASLMDRLSRFAAQDGAVAAQFDAVDAFGKLKRAALRVAEEQSEMPAADIAAVFIALIRFTGAVYPDRLEAVDEVLAACQQALESRNVAADARAEKQLVALLTIPLESYDVVTVLGLGRYPALMGLLQLSMRKEMAVKIVQSILKNDTKVTSVERVRMLLDFINPLVRDVAGIDEDPTDEDFVEEQGQVARLIMQLRADGADEQIGVLQAARERFAEGGPGRLKHTMPALGFAALQLVRQMAAERGAGVVNKTSLREVLQFAHGVIAALAEVPGCTEQALQMFLTGALAASEEARLEIIAYEFVEQAFILYEEAVPDSKGEVTALQSIVGTLHRCRVFGPENRAALAHKATGFSAKLLRRTDQCRALLVSANLHWQAPDPEPPVAPASPPQAEGEAVAPSAAEQAGDDAAPASEADERGAAEQPASDRQKGASVGDDEEGDEDGQRHPPVRDGAAVMTCLKRALKVANAAQQQLAMSAKRTGLSEPVRLYVDILNQYLFFFDQGVPNITISVLQSLLELVANEMAIEAVEADGALCRYYANTLAYIRSRSAAGRGEDSSAGIAKQYADLQL